MMCVGSGIITKEGVIVRGVKVCPNCEGSGHVEIKHPKGEGAMEFLSNIQGGD